VERVAHRWLAVTVTRCNVGGLCSLGVHDSLVKESLGNYPVGLARYEAQLIDELATAVGAWLRV